MDKLKVKAHKLLRRSEKHFKTDMVYLARGGFWLAGSKVITAFAAFLLSIAFANLLPKETYGAYQFILSLATLLSIPTLTRMHTALTRSVARGFEGSLIDAMKAKIKWGMLGSVASILLSLYYYLNGNITFTLAFLITAIFIPISSSFNIYNSLQVGRKLFKQSAFDGILKQAVNVVAIITVLLITSNVLVIIFTYYFVNTITSFVLNRWKLATLKPNDHKDPEAISYGKHLSLMGVLGIIAGQIDKILIWHNLGATPLAVYAFALAPVTQLQGALKPIESLAFPKLANNNLIVIRKTLPRKMLRFLFILIIPVGMYIMVAPYIYKLLFPQYVDAVVYSQWLVLILLFFPQKLMGAVFTAHAHKKALYVLSIINPLTKIAALFVLLPLYGIAGAVAALIIPYFANTIVFSYFFFKK